MGDPDGGMGDPDFEAGMGDPDEPEPAKFEYSEVMDDAEK